MIASQTHRFSVRFFLAVLCFALSASQGVPSSSTPHIENLQDYFTHSEIADWDDGSRDSELPSAAHHHNHLTADRAKHPALTDTTPRYSQIATVSQSAAFTAQDHYSELIRPPAIV